MRFLSILVAVAALCLGCANARMPKMPDPYDLESATVALVGTNKYGDIKIFCTATWISENKLLTAAHCALFWQEINQEPAYSTEREAGEVEEDITGKHPLKVLAMDEENDLALLHAPKPTRHHSVDVARFQPDLGEHVAILGHPARQGWSHMEGVVSAFRHQHGFIQDDGTIVYGAVMQVQAPVWGGNSGGGAFNGDGDLVGVCSYSRSDVPDMSYFISLRPIQKFLLRNLHV